jgi:glycerate dehydrogenase
MNIVFLDKSTVGNVPNLDKLGKYGDVSFFEMTNYQETLERCKHADIVITNKVVIDKKVIDGSPHLKQICIAATGMNNVDLEYAKIKGIKVDNVSGYSTFSVTQSTFAMLLSLMNSIQYYDSYVKSGDYVNSPIFTHHGREFWELKGKTYGIIGMGAIGQSVAKIAEVFGCTVIYFSTSGKNNSQPYKNVDLGTLLKNSDIISIHAPLNDTTYNLIDLQKLNHMKKNCILINAGRGNIVNEKDLAIAIDQGIIYGAGLDVFGHEPIKSNNPLLKIKNKERLLIMPHIAWASIEARTLLIDSICENIDNFLKNRDID